MNRILPLLFASLLFCFGCGDDDSSGADTGTASDTGVGATCDPACETGFTCAGSTCQCDNLSDMICPMACPSDPDCAVTPDTLCSDTCDTSNDGECDDGGPDSEFDLCEFGSDCTDCGPRPGNACVPSCSGRSCGDDGCGGTCGDCGVGMRCTSDGICADVSCTPSCGAAVCGDDGCGGSCGSCPAGQACNASGMCTGGTCTPSCPAGSCGSDGCGGTCECAGGQRCDFGSCVDTVDVGSSCSECDDIFDAVGNCFQTGRAVVSTCGGTSSGDPRDIPYCRRGPGDSRGYCTISCSSGSCPSGYTCQDTGAGIRGCLR